MLRDQLQGFDACPPEIAGNMTMVPLVSQDAECGQVGELHELYIDTDVDYGAIVMATQSPQVTIVPQGLVYITR